MSNLNNKKINICILEMSSQNKAILEFFFANSGKSLFEETSLDHASAYIVDYDYPEAKEHAEKIHSTYKLPGIIISIKEVQIPDTVWIAKPLTIKALSSANQKIAKIISEIAEKEKFSSSESNNQTIHQSQEKILPEETLLTQKNNTQDKQNSNIENIEIQKTVKKESIHKKQPTIQNNDTISAKTPAFADFDDELPYVDDLQIENTIEQEVAESHSSTDKEVDELLLQLNNDTFDDLIIEDSPTNVAELQNNHSENLSPLDFGIEDEALEKEKPAIHQEEIIAPPDTSIPLKMADDGFLELELSDDNNGKDKQDQSSILDDHLDKSIQELQGEVELTLDTQEFDAQVLESTDEEAPSNFEDTIDDSTSNPSTNNSAPEHALNSISEEIKPESILEQVNEQLNDELLNIDTFSLNNTETNDEADNKFNDTIVEQDNLDKNDIQTKIHQSESTQLPNKSTADLTDLKATSTEDVSTTNHAEITSNNTEPSSNKNNSLEPNLSANVNKTEENNESSVEIDPTLAAEEELQRLLEEIRQEAEGQKGKLIYNNTGTGSNTYRHTPTFAEERWALTCGDNDAIASKKNPYQPNKHMLHTLLKVIEKSKSTEKVMRLKFNGIIIVVIPDSQKIYCDISIHKNNYADICFNPINQENIKIHYLDKSEIRLYQKAINEEPELSHNFESFIWTTSLLTSRGRLPHGTDIKRTVAIKYWPDLTRLETFPHMMHISAVFYKHPGSLKEVPTWLGIEQRYVYAFYNGALSLNLMELDQKQLKINKSNSFKKTQNRGFFSRLLKRINT